MTDSIVMFLLALVGAGIGAYVGSYLREKGKNLATREDIDALVRKTEEIKAEITGDLWVKQKRWNAKWECYAELVVNLGELHTLISEAIGIQSRGPRPGQDAPAFDREVQEKTARAEAAFAEARKFGSKARLAVGPEGRTALTRFGDKWNNLRGSSADQGTIVRDAWMEITDMARNDLYGEPRENSGSGTGKSR